MEKHLQVFLALHHFNFTCKSRGLLIAATIVRQHVYPVRPAQRSHKITHRFDIRLIVEPHTQTDPELKTDRRYTNLSAAEASILGIRSLQENELTVTTLQEYHAK